MTEPRRAWISTGEGIRVDGFRDQIPPFDKRTGDHFWFVSPVFRVNPLHWTDPTHTPMLDAENLVMILPPGCFYCEQPYTHLLASRRCRGHG